MRGNMSSGSFAAGFMVSQSLRSGGGGSQGNEGAIIGSLALFGAAAGIYGIALMLDQPARETFANEIVERSIAICTNAESNPALYTTDLKKSLKSIWSVQLNRYIPAADNAPICEDPDINVALRDVYDVEETRYTSEFRMMGVVYTHSDGSQAFVVKPENKNPPKNTEDIDRDALISMGTVLDALNTMQANVPQLTLADGTKVAVFFQHDGVKQRHGSGSIYDNDGKVWANEEQLQRLLKDYSFASPVKASYVASASVQPQLMQP